MGLEILKDELMDGNNDLQRKELLLSVIEIREACDISLTILNDLLLSNNVNTSNVELERKLVDIFDVLRGNVGLFETQVWQKFASIQVFLNARLIACMHLSLHLVML